MSIGWLLLKHINLVVARLRGSVGWCYMAYKFSRQGLPDDEDWEGFAPRSRIASWWGAFTFKYRPLVEANEE